MKALVVDDNRTNLIALQAMLERFGYEVVTAHDGADGLAVFQLEQPDLVVMDVVMPVMDGYEATRRIKRQCDGRFVPVIFITSLSGTDDLVKCVDAGGDDFIVRPFDMAILEAKLVALQRIVRVYANLKAHERALEAHNRRLDREMQVGQTVLAKILRRGTLDDPALRYWMLPLGVFNGDLLLSARTPAGGVHVMLGDITGHGLSAAMGAQPVADVFYGMSDKGFSIGDIAVEINRRLYATLHPEIFCAACLVELDPERSTATIWNGAMPDVFIVDAQGGQTRRISSGHQALGVVPDEKFNRQAAIVPINGAERIHIFSDGFIDARNYGGEKFGMARLAQRFEKQQGAAVDIEDLKADLFAHLGEAAPGDDVSVVTLECGNIAAVPARSVPQHRLRSGKPARWQAEVTLYADALRNINPVPVITNLITEVQAPQGHRERIFTVVSELVTNALDHGLLGLDSSAKHGPEGFARYYRQRADALSRLEEGWLLINVEHTPSADGGLLLIRVEDSGPGFDVPALERCLKEPATNTNYCGRGITLLRNLCEYLTFKNRGNCVEAAYRWSA
jgi:CheY-like chemotaxis protein/anti-sigma regulatory factor (Ser/Thr protein kinase)